MMLNRSAQMKLLPLALLFSVGAVCPTYRGTLQEPSDGRKIQAVRVSEDIKIDGQIDEAAWKQAAKVSTFFQREPFEKEKPTEKTEVRILYDHRFLYFGVHCFDSEPKKVVASELRRDADFSVDDSFTVLLSPTNDKRNGYT